MRTFLLFFAIVSAPFWLNAQVEHGGEPASWERNLPLSNVPEIELPHVDHQALLEEDAQRSDQLKEQRFGYNHQVNILPGAQGTYHELSNGTRIWRVRVESDSAYSLNFGFDPFHLEEGAKVFIYTPDQRDLLGAFTHKNNKDSRILPTTIIPGDEAIIELVEPASVKGKSELGIKRVSHDYRNIVSIAQNLSTRGYGDAGACNMNVNCPDGAPWQDEKRSVALMINNGSRFCTGALLNNTDTVEIPYFLTANHCYESMPNTSGWVFMFNYESPGCTDQNGPTNETVSGAVLKARSQDSDFCLVELSSTPPSSYQVYYAGWDHSGNIPDSTVGIHHPSGDIKKISFDDDSPSSGTFGNSINGGEWHIQQWDRNTTTEGGSSGSPLFDQNHRVVGQLHGGSAFCGNSVDDYYGKFSISWDYNSSDTSQLKAWLDPKNTGQTSLPGWDPNAGNNQYDAAVVDVFDIGNVGDVVCGDTAFNSNAVIENFGSATLTSLRIHFELGSQQSGYIDWSGSLSTGERDTVQLPWLWGTSGSYTLNVYSRDPNGKSDQNSSNDQTSRNIVLSPDKQPVSLDVKTDCWGEETSWSLIETSTNDTLYSIPFGTYPGSSGNPYSGGFQTTEKVCLSNGCYDLLVEDSYGDGMNGSQYNSCSVDGDIVILGEYGSYYGEILDPAFGSDTTLNFCITNTSVQEKEDQSWVRIYPNPTEGHLQVEISGLDSDVSVRVNDMTGRKVLERNLGGIRKEWRGILDLSSLKSGIYMLSIRSNKKLFTEKIRVE